MYVGKRATVFIELEMAAGRSRLGVWLNYYPIENVEVGVGWDTTGVFPHLRYRVTADDLLELALLWTAMFGPELPEASVALANNGDHFPIATLSTSRR